VRCSPLGELLAANPRRTTAIAKAASGGTRCRAQVAAVAAQHEACRTPRLPPGRTVAPHPGRQLASRSRGPASTMLTRDCRAHAAILRTWRSAQRSAAVVACAPALRPVATRSISPEISLDKSGRPKKIEAFVDVGTWRAASTALPKAGNVRSVPHPAPRCGPSDTVTIMLAVRHQRCEGSSAWTIRSGRSRRSCRSMMRTRRQATTHARTEVAPSRRNA